MIVCHCEAVSDRAIRKAIRKGAATVGEVGERCGAGKSCGGCVPEIERLLYVEQPVALAGATI